MDINTFTQIIGGINCASSAAKEMYGKITALGDQIAGHVNQISEGAVEVFDNVRRFRIGPWRCLKA
jgi:hypothetical protein